MKLSLARAIALSVLAALIVAFAGSGEPAPSPSYYTLLDPITHGDLTVFPVVSSQTYDTNQFLTLDEGIRSGEVVVTEVGNLHGTMHRRPIPQAYQGGAQVNTLVLVNNSQRPLLLLAAGKRSRRPRCLLRRAASLGRNIGEIRHACICDGPAQRT